MPFMKENTSLIKPIIKF